MTRHHSSSTSSDGVNQPHHERVRRSRLLIERQQLIRLTAKLHRTFQTVERIQAKIAHLLSHSAP